MVLTKLSDTTISKINSGQVISDLLAVVKELMENALDAGAKSIEIKLEKDGLGLIQVRDNGTGINPVDRETCALGHYTSKISDFLGIASLKTYGFRGEALHSLCSEADVTLTTRTKGEERGVTITFSKIGAVQNTVEAPIGTPFGTTIEARNLFANMPVRLERFKNEENGKKECKRIHEMIIAYSLVLPQVRFYMKSSPSNFTLSKPPTRSISESLIEAFGPLLIEQLVHIDYNSAVSEEITTTPLKKLGKIDEDLEIMKAIGDDKYKGIEGFLPLSNSDTKITTRPQNDRCFLYVNKRPVDIPAITKLVNIIVRKWFVLNNTRRYPFIFFNFILPPWSYDINITPDKRKILLHQEDEILHLIRNILVKIYPIEEDPGLKLIKEEKRDENNQQHIDDVFKKVKKGEQEDDDYQRPSQVEKREEKEKGKEKQKGKEREELIDLDDLLDPTCDPGYHSSSPSKPSGKTPSATTSTTTTTTSSHTPNTNTHHTNTNTTNNHNNNNNNGNSASRNSTHRDNNNNNSNNNNNNTQNRPVDSFVPASSVPKTTRSFDNHLPTEYYEPTVSPLPTIKSPSDTIQDILRKQKESKISPSVRDMEDEHFDEHIDVSNDTIHTNVNNRNNNNNNNNNHTNANNNNNNNNVNRNNANNNNNNNISTIATSVNQDEDEIGFITKRKSTDEPISSEEPPVKQKKPKATLSKQMFEIPLPITLQQVLGITKLFPQRLSLVTQLAPSKLVAPGPHLLKSSYISLKPEDLQNLSMIGNLSDSLVPPGSITSFVSPSRNKGVFVLRFKREEKTMGSSIIFFNSLRAKEVFVLNELTQNWVSPKSALSKPFLLTKEVLENDPSLWSIAMSNSYRYVKIFHLNGFELIPRYDTDTKQQLVEVKSIPLNNSDSEESITVNDVIELIKKIKNTIPTPLSHDAGSSSPLHTSSVTPRINRITQFLQNDLRNHVPKDFHPSLKEAMEMIVKIVALNSESTQECPHQKPIFQKVVFPSLHK